MFFYYDSYYLLLVLPAILLSLFAQMKVKSTYKKYAEASSARGITAREAVEEVLAQNGVSGVRIERIAGELTDHYDPRTNVIRLSDSVYGSASVASLGVAAHEAGHAVQYAKGYLPIKLRNTVLPAANLGSTLSVPLVLLGFILGAPALVTFGILLFSLVLLFQVITLPVEFNASRRALLALEDGNLLHGEELTGAKKVLSAAALTYVAAVLTSLAQLLRLVLLSRRRNR